MKKKIRTHRNKLAYVLFSRADHRAGFSSRTDDEGRFGENSRSFLPSDDADDESVAKTLPRRSQIASSRKTSGQTDRPEGHQGRYLHEGQALGFTGVNNK
jgi:hypothetical protein